MRGITFSSMKSSGDAQRISYVRPPLVDFLQKFVKLEKILYSYTNKSIQNIHTFPVRWSCASRYEEFGRPYIVALWQIDGQQFHDLAKMIPVVKDTVSSVLVWKREGKEILLVCLCFWCVDFFYETIAVMQ